MTKRTLSRVFVNEVERLFSASCTYTLFVQLLSAHSDSVVTNIYTDIQIVDS